MTIGPAPIRQIESRSGRLGKAAHLLDPARENRPGVVRSGTGLGMELDGSGAQLGELEALDRAVVERHVRRLAILARGDGETVVLARHEHASAGPLDDRVISAAVSELELERLVAARQGEQLVAEADAQDGNLAEQLLHRHDLLLKRPGVSGA